MQLRVGFVGRIDGDRKCGVPEGIAGGRGVNFGAVLVVLLRLDPSDGVPLELPEGGGTAAAETTRGYQADLDL